MNKNDFFNFLSIPFDDSISIDNVEIIDDVKYIYISRYPSPHFCDNCGSRMHSKGIYKRTIQHPVLQDSTRIVIIVKQRKWKCCNPECNTYKNEEFPFIVKFSHTSTLTPFMILETMKDLNRTTSSVAKQFYLSDTQVHNLFAAYVDLPRLPLPEYMSIDEVFLDISDNQKFAFVIMDFSNGDIIDIVHNRWKDTLLEYFETIPKEERKNVKGVISDAYDTYFQVIKECFPKAVSVLDSFHVMKKLISALNTYIYQVEKRYKEKEKFDLERKNHETNKENKTIKHSNEVILLQHYKWIILKNRDEINYSTYRSYHKLLKMYLDTHTIEKMFFALDKNFKYFRDMKELYVSFNHTEYESEDEIRSALSNLIKIYKASDHYIFRDFGRYLESYIDPIIHSFITVPVVRKTVNEQNEYYTRLSNGPMESFNRKPKDYKRNSRGSSNFDYTRNRILWSMRKNPSIRAIPKSYEQIHSYKGKKRGPYKKRKR